MLSKYSNTLPRGPDDVRRASSPKPSLLLTVTRPARTLTNPPPAIPTMSKKAAKPKDEVTYEIRDIVLAKIRGFPAWPAMVGLIAF